MPKKPVPSKKQAVSSTKSRYGSYVRKRRIKLTNQLALDTCPSCGKTKRRHFVCQECGKYKERVVVAEKKKASAFVQEIEA